MEPASIAIGSGPRGDKVSVIVPTYNRARLIHESIHSVLTQTHADLEVIIVDDGSTDDTAAVVSAIADSRIRYIHQPNRGRSNARNHGLSVATGTYIAFLDSDDLYLPDKIALQVSYLSSHPGTGMVYTSANCIDDRGQVLAHKYEASVSGLIYGSIAFFTPVTITLPTVMTYRAIMDQVGGFDEALHRFEDTDMWRRISKAFRIDAMPEVTCLLRTHDDNSLLSQDPDAIVAALECYAAKILREDTEVDIAIRQRGLAGLYRYYGHALLSVRQFADRGRTLVRIASRYERIAGSYAGRSSALGGQVPVSAYRRRLYAARFWAGQSARLIYYRCGLHAVRFWAGWSARFIYYRCGLHAARFWAGWTMRFVFYRSANVAYRMLCRVRRLRTAAWRRE